MQGGGGVPVLRDLDRERAVERLELGWTAQRQGLGDERYQGERRCDGDEAGPELDQALHAVVGLPDRPDAHDMGQPAGRNERGEHQEHPRERDLAPPQHESEQRDRDEEIGERNQPIRKNV
jgi:hypothetical protein